jgi:hypothetical protein
MAARGEELAGPRITRDVQRTPLKISDSQDNRSTVGVSPAGHLAQNPVVAISVCQCYSGAESSLPIKSEKGKRMRTTRGSRNI